MRQNAYTYTSMLFYARFLCFFALCFSAFTLYAGKRHRMQSKYKQLAQLENTLSESASLTENLGLPDSSQEADFNQDTIPLDEQEPISIIMPETDILSSYDTTQEELSDESLEIDELDEIEFYFENAELQNFVEQIEDIFDVTFLTDDMIDPLPQNSKSIKGNKISYRTIKPISRAQAWNTFNTFLNIAGFHLIPHSNERTYRITATQAAQKAPIPSYIGIEAISLPDSNELIRYVYFIENNSVESIKAVIEQFRSSSSTAVYLNEHKGFILTDIAYNIKKLMEVVKELDTISMPESLSVLKLRRADAKHVKELYDSLTQKEPDQRFGPRIPARKAADSLALPENITLIAEPRTNSLILLGPQNARERIEEFITKNVDVELDQDYSPLHTYKLRFANAETIAQIMNTVTKFGQDTDAGRSGGVRGGDKYMRPISFIAEPTTNKLIIKGHYEDYLKAVEIIEVLDIDQPQVAIEVLILSVDISKQKELGSQIRTKAKSNNNTNTDGILGNNVNFQTSGLFAGTQPGTIQQKPGSETVGMQRILGNLLNLVSAAPGGNTIITLGKDMCGVWGIMQLLETVSNVQLVSNPFLIATNKTEAEVSLGQTRRVVTATTQSSGSLSNLDSFGDEKAELFVKATPQINSDGMIVLDLEIKIDNFTSASGADKNTKEIKTSTILANKQILALGGLVRNKISNDMNKTPFLGEVPVLGWLFKNKRKQEEKENLLVLVSTRIIEPANLDDLYQYNKKHISEYHNTIDELDNIHNKKDPIHKMFFEAAENSTEKQIDDFLFKRRKSQSLNPRERRRKKRLAQQHRQKSHMLPAQEMTQIASNSINPNPINQKKVSQKHPIIAKQGSSSPSVRSHIADNTVTGKRATLRSSLQNKKRTDLALTSLLSQREGGLAS